MKKSILLSLALSIGFVMCSYSQNIDNKIVVNVAAGKDSISRQIYGHFSEHLGHCIYGGIWVGENSTIPNVRGIRSDVVKALREMGIPNLRWPGGCFADEYHWRNGIGPRKVRPTMINTNWGGVTEDNSFGTHEFMDLCEQINCEPVICGNLGSGTVEEMSQWVEYLNSDNVSPMTDLRKKNGREKPWKVKYFGVGNESWGCGGNMKPEYYFDLEMRYASFCKNYGGTNLYRIASGPNADDYNWTEVMMREWSRKSGWPQQNINGLSLHYYTVCGDWDKKGSATAFDEKDWFTTLSKTLKMEELIAKHSAIMDKYDSTKRVGLIVDEWGNWHDVEPGTNPGFLFQQNTLRDAMVAALNLNIFQAHCDRVKMANIAQIINVLQSVILTKDNQIVLTPTYYVFKMYKVHQDALMLPVEIQCADYEVNGQKIKAVSASASKDKNGKIHISLVNVDPNKTQKISCEIKGADESKVTGEIITASKINTYNDFGKPEEVRINVFEGAKLNKGKLELTLPAKSIVTLELVK